MKTVQNQKDKEALLKRLQQLNSNTERRWGMMSPEEMLWHLRSQLELALGLNDTRFQPTGIMTTKLVRWLSIYIVPWPKGFRTARPMNVHRVKPDLLTLDEERQLLLARLEAVLQSPRLEAHPLFGAISNRAWYRLIWRHFDHHLRQFGL
jgi:hypothetical protein